MTITPVIVSVDSQRDAVERLVRHCRQLDHTDLQVIRLTPQDDARFRVEHPLNEKACRAAFALNHAARALGGKPFLWLEHDAIPLQKGWLARISKEYARLGKPFMLSSDSNPPYDRVGGIGVYPGQTSWMIPTNLSPRPGRKDGSGWDLWMLENLRPLISRTRLIQHSYGIYDDTGRATPHRFPRDSRLIRRETLIFHRDPSQDLMKPESIRPEPLTFCHAGDLGDTVYALEVIRRLGGGKLMLGSEMGFTFPTRCREAMTPGRVENMKPLLIEQPYIGDVAHFEGQPHPDWINLNRFREIFRGSNGPGCTNLQRAPLRRFGLSVQDETKPWLRVGARDSALEESLIVARSPRYQNPAFPWKQIVKRYRDRILFVGLDIEYQAFCHSVGTNVGRYPATNLLELAIAINSGRLFIGNQSCPYAIAEGLKRPAIQESWPYEPNCLFQRPHLLHLTTEFDKIQAFVERYL